MWTFLDDLRVPFDNHHAERDLRMIQVQHKVSGCFRTEAHAEASARIRGSLSTYLAHAGCLCFRLSKPLHAVFPFIPLFNDAERLRSQQT